MLRRLVCVLAIHVLMAFAARQTMVAQSFTLLSSNTTVLGADDGWGASWGDYDNDGDPDLFLALSDQANALFKNNGDGTFTRVTDTPITQGNVVSSNGMWMDYDADGDLDLYVSNYGLQVRDEGAFILPTPQFRPNQLFRNDNGTFTAITDNALVLHHNASWGSSWGDYDNDGDVDVFVAGDAGHANFLFRNDGSGNYTPVTDMPIVEAGGPTRSATWIDYDEDADLDLFLVHFMTGGTRLNLYRNQLQETGVATFEAHGETPMETDTFASGTWSATWADYDADGHQDLYITTHFSGSANLLYRNANGQFQARSQHILGRENESASDACWGDYDNDGDVDLFISVSTTRPRPSRFYRNNGNGMFEQLTLDAFQNAPALANGCAMADYDNDGDLDLYVVTGSAFFLTTPVPNLLFRNDDGNQNNWINLDLRARGLNPYALGARVEITAVLDGQIRTQTRWLTGNAGDRTQSDFRIHVGLGKATTIEQIAVYWPSGAIDTFAQVAVNQFLRITEGQPLTPVVNERASKLPTRMHLAQNYPNPFNPQTTIAYTLSQGSAVRLTIHDVLGHTVRVLADEVQPAGTHHLTFDGTDLPSGIYFYRLSMGTTVQSKRMVLLR